MPRHPTALLPLVTAVFTAAAAVPSAVLADEVRDEQLDAVRARISEVFEMIEPEHVRPSPVDGWYTIQKGSIVAYVSADGRYLLQGDLIDLDAGINLTEASRDFARKELMAGLDDDEFITFSPDDVKHRVTVFTDIGCTYCRRLHQQIDDYLERGIEVRYLLYPRNGPASPEWATSEKVWCARDRNAALTAAKRDRPFESGSCDTSSIQDHYVLGREVGLSGTPAIVLDDGTLIGGYLPPDALAQQLEHSEPQAKR